MSDALAGAAQHVHLDTLRMLTELSKELESICSDMLHPAHLFHQTGLLPTNLYDNLLCLDAHEFRFLPLWAPDGNDDGTGGVFNDTIPDADPESAKYEAVGGAGRRLQTRGQAPPSAGDDSSVEDLASQAISTVGKASKVATDGRTDTVQSISTMSVGESDDDAQTVFADDSRSVALDMDGEDGPDERDTHFDPAEEDEGLFDDEIYDDDDDDDDDDEGPDSDTETVHHREDEDRLFARLEPDFHSTAAASDVGDNAQDHPADADKGKSRDTNGTVATVEDADEDDDGDDFVLL
jgi:hypothetical protein